jgi:threonylcarbamoyladenosine tRNA methylthiotransferase MtaB
MKKESNNIYAHTFGCKVNQYETQLIVDSFIKKGHRPVKELNKADILLINSCTVTAEADRQCRQLIRQALRKNPDIRVLATGCYAIASPQDILNISPSVIILNKESILNGGAINRFDGHSRAFIKIQDGCDAFCSYCIVPYVRSKITSRPAAEIISEIRNLTSSGYPEIVLTGVRLGKYEGGLEGLVRKILEIEGNFRVRFSSLELSEVSAGLLALMRDNPVRICSHLHIPLQSGSDNILKQMKRPYTAGKFKEKVEQIKGYIPDAGITTDVIVGFPGETEADFSKTYGLLQSSGFSRLHVFRYSKRQGTLAAGFKDEVPEQVIRERSKVLRQLDGELQTSFWKSFIGTVRQAAPEGAKNTLLTDNYIRLYSDIKTHSNCNKIINVKIANNDGRPWALVHERNLAKKRSTQL